MNHKIIPGIEPSSMIVIRIKPCLKLICQTKIFSKWDRAKSDSVKRPQVITVLITFKTENVDALKRD